MNHFSTDVLVIGSGGAGLQAAIQAAQKGARVILVTKSRVGRANCTAVAMGAFKVFQKVDADHHFYETLQAGRFLNSPKLVRTLVDEAWPSITALNSYVDISIEPGKAVVASDKTPAGILLTRALAAAADDAGVAVLEKSIVVDLPVDERCLGAVAFKTDTGELVTISAKATILATGGYSQVFLRNDNPPPVTGDGLILAYRAGASLQDMEFVQFLPLFTDAGVPKTPVVDWLIEGTKHLVPGGPLSNSKGERFLDSYNLLHQPILRDNLTVAIERELIESDSIILDLTSLSPDEIVEAFDSDFKRTAIHPFLKIVCATPLHIASYAHFTMGGITIDEKCSTAVEGLYAAGEVASGVHGANRLGGNALTEIFVFGTIAGNTAAHFSSQTPVQEIDKKYVKKVELRIAELKKRKKKSVDPFLIKKDVQSIMSQFCQPVRSGKGLCCALEKLEETEEKAACMVGRTPAQVKTALEAQFMGSVARLVVTAALSRKESRGPHFRTDYPRCDQNWLKNVVFSQKGGTVTIRYVSPP
jgi:fumarate reductase (CoM/CoB) subunit A